MPFWEDYCAEKPQILTSINHFFKNSLPCWGLRSLDVMNVWRGGDGLKQTLLISSLELISRTQTCHDCLLIQWEIWDFYSNCWHGVHGCKLKRLNCSEAGEMRRPEIANYCTRCACDLILTFVFQFFKDGSNPAWTITRTSTHLLMSSNWIKQETTTLSLLSSL